MEIINLDMTPSTVTPNAHAGQYDASRTVRFMLKNGGVPFTLAGTETITAEITRSDNTEVTVNVANTSSNYVDVVFDDTVCTVKGLYACELRIVDGGVDIGSKNFALLVQRDPYDGAGVRIVTVGPADICTFETTLAEPLQSVLVNVLATGGNGTPDSPNPINGYSSANITRCGVNLLHVNSRVSQTTAQVIYTSDDNYIEMNGTKYGGTYADLSALEITLPAGTYYLKAFEISGTATNAPSITAYNGSDLTSNILNNERVLTLNAPTTFRFRFALWTDNAVYTNYKVGIAISTASISEYSEYNGQNYVVSFGQTVYGGVLDVTSGKLKPCIEYPSYNGETLSGRWLSSEATYIEGTTPPTGSQVVSLDDYGTDIDLTPKVISAIVGTNNVFAGCGDIAVEYLDLL